jgi:leucyl aminopeptidase
MRADIFYHSHEKQSLPFCFVTKSQWEAGTPELTEIVRQALTTQQFKGQLGDVALVNSDQDSSMTAFIGAGDDNPILAMAHAANRLPPGYYEAESDLSPLAILMWSLAQYRFDRYKKFEAEPRVLLVDNSKLSKIQIEAEALFLVRDLINTPTNDMGPSELAKAALDIAEQMGAEYQEWVGDELLKSNFPAIHMVGRASANSPRLLSITWGDKSHPRVCLVGKGVCFDSGGLDIKPSSGMRLMKKDMGGAAHVLGLAYWIMKSQLPVRLQVLIPAVENAIGSDAFRPGDVLTMRNGLTVEVDNTDAEGRLVLADALVKAGEESPELLIDFATLTGSARTAVGTDIAAMFCNDDQLAQGLTESSSAINDPVWRLPLFSGYASMLDSSIADLSNASASPYAGAITAALFLQRFVPDGASWVHFDIMAWNLSSKPGRPEGGEALGLRAVAHYLQTKYGMKD